MKLVRDRIGDIPWPDEHNKSLLGWVAPDSPEYRELLRLKLFEEAGELADADRRGDADAVLDEAADVFEVLRALLLANGCAAVPSSARRVLQDAVDRKFAERGGFLWGRTWSARHTCDEKRGAFIGSAADTARCGCPSGRPVKAPANTCCDDSGFADYAAVPCPNPTCTAPPMGGKLKRIVEDMATAAERGAVPFVHMIEDPERRCTCPIDPDGPERGDPLSTCPIHGWVVGGTPPTTPPASTEADEDASVVGEDAPSAPGGSQAAEEYTGRCPKCFSKSWVSVSLNGGYTRVPQCVPCGAIHAHTLGPGWRAW